MGSGVCHSAGDGSEDYVHQTSAQLVSLKARSAVSRVCRLCCDSQLSSLRLESSSRLSSGARVCQISGRDRHELDSLGSI